MKNDADKIYVTKKSKWDRFEPQIPFIMLGLFIVVITLMFFMRPIPASVVPSEFIPIYKSVENTGGLFGGRAEYYLFDESGHRLQVTQKVFDSYVSLERE